MIRQESVITASLRLAEHLMQAHKRRVVDPLIASVALITANRFRSQRRALDDALDEIEPLLPDHDRMARSLPQAASLAILTAFKDFKFPSFDDRLDAETRQAFDAGWGVAATQLDISDPPPDRQFNDLVTEDVDATTRGAILDAATKVFAGGLTFAALVSAVEEIFQDAVENRASMIATTEIASAFNGGAKALATNAKQQGASVEKMWNAEPDACEDCAANAAQEWISDDEDFESGDDAPPAHPNCVCSLELRTAEE